MNLYSYVCFLSHNFTAPLCICQSTLYSKNLNLEHYWFLIFSSVSALKKKKVAAVSVLQILDKMLMLSKEELTMAKKHEHEVNFINSQRNRDENNEKSVSLITLAKAGRKKEKKKKIPRVHSGGHISFPRHSWGRCCFAKGRLTRICTVCLLNH